MKPKNPDLPTHIDPRVEMEGYFWPFVRCGGKPESDFSIEAICADMGLSRTQACVLMDRVFNQFSINVCFTDKPHPLATLHVGLQDMTVNYIDVAKLIEEGLGERNQLEDADELAVLQGLRVLIDELIEDRVILGLNEEVAQAEEKVGGPIHFR